MVHALDPDAEGKILWQTRAGAGGLLGGSQWGSAADNQRVYVAISDVILHSVADAAAPGGSRVVLDPKRGGGLHAIDLKSGRIAWSAAPAACPGTPEYLLTRAIRRRHRHSLERGVFGRSSTADICAPIPARTAA